MTYTVELSKPAAKQLSKLPKQDQPRIQNATNALKDTPRPHGMKKLTDQPGYYRVEVPPYRIVYTIKDSPENEVTIIAIRDRKDVYRKL